jgi:hypothetical protein
MNDPKDMPNLKAIKLTAWASLMLVALAVLVPIEYRPTSTFSPDVERFAAFAAVGFAFALAYPRRLWLAALVVVGAALTLEALQMISPTRHGRLPDASIKALGAAVGFVIGWLLLIWQARRERVADVDRDAQRSRV